MCEIRIARPEDSDAIARIGRTTFAMAYGDIVRPADMALYLQQMFNPQRIRAEIVSETAYYFVASDHRTTLGYAKLAESEQPEQWPQNNCMELVRLYIAQGEYGKGIGGKLLTAAREKAVASGCEAWWLRVWEKNELALRFYERAGFKRVGVEPYLIGETANPVVIMYEAVQ